MQPLHFHPDSPQPIQESQDLVTKYLWVVLTRDSNWQTVQTSNLREMPKMFTFLPQTGLGSGAPLLDELIQSLENPEADRFDCAVAYALKSGLDALEPYLNGKKCRWIVGLDDYVTEPVVLKRLLSFSDHSTRVVSLSKSKARFHPKIYSITSSTNSSFGHLFVGSNNLSSGGFSRNSEFSVKMSSNSEADTKSFSAAYESIWSTGVNLNDQSLSDYETLFSKAKSYDSIAKPILPDLAFNDPGNAANQHVVGIWIEIGSATAMGREVELPKALSWFFSSLIGSPNFVDALGRSLDVSYAYRADNMMYRLGFKVADIQRITGRTNFRPQTGGNRSDLVISLARKVNGDVEVEVSTIGSSQYMALKAISSENGSLAKTAYKGGRYYGTW